jgi:hypothetical protein
MDTPLPYIMNTPSKTKTRMIGITATLEVFSVCQ